MDSIIHSETAIHVAKVISFPSAFFVAGYTFSFSQNTLLALYDHRPQTTTPVFKQVWHRAGAVIPTLTLLSSSTSAYLAYALPAQRRDWATAAVVMLATFPWTRVMIVPGVQRIVQISKDKEKMGKSEQTLEHRQLMIRWVKQNYVAVALQFASAVVGLRAIVSA